MTTEQEIASRLNESLARQYAAEAWPSIAMYEDSYYVRSRTKPDVAYRVDVTVDGTLLCSCPAATNGRDCWHVKYVKEETMTSQVSTAVVPVRIQPMKSLVPSDQEMTAIDKAAALALAGAIALPKELNTREKVASVMLYGRELGLAPMTSIRHIYIVNGRPQPSAEVMAGLVVSREPDARIEAIEVEAEACTMRLSRPSRGIIKEYRVTKEDATKAGLWGKGVWAQYPRDMLRWHCTKRLLRTYAPDLINGIEALAEPTDEPVAPQQYRVIDVTPEEKASLYNDGDDAETTPFVPGASEPTEPAFDRTAVSKECQRLIAELKGTTDKEWYGGYMKDLEAKYSRGGKFSSSALSDEDLQSMLIDLQVANGFPPATEAAAETQEALFS